MDAEDAGRAPVGEMPMTVVALGLADTAYVAWRVASTRARRQEMDYIGPQMDLARAGTRTPIVPRLFRYLGHNLIWDDGSEQRRGIPTGFAPQAVPQPALGGRVQPRADG